MNKNPNSRNSLKKTQELVKYHILCYYTIKREFLNDVDGDDKLFEQNDDQVRQSSTEQEIEFFFNISTKLVKDAFLGEILGKNSYQV